MAKGAPITNERSANDVIQGIEELDIDDSDKLYMYVQLCNKDILMQHLKKQAMMLKIGIVPEDPIYTFAYGILKLVSPHLFEGEEG